MNADDVENVISTMREHWSRKIGIHAHNNMGQALSNAKVAMQLNVELIDSTVTGMGRGAGNVETEM